MAVRLIKMALMMTIIAFVILSGWNHTEAHHAVVRFNLEDMEATADRIFLGRCVSVEETTEHIAQGQMPVTHYTFEVERAFKGTINKKYKFTQLGHPARPLFKERGIQMHGRAVKPGEFIHGMSEYEVGDRLLLFLIPNYLGNKVTYPVGLYQGAFFVSTMPSGNELARNSINNIGLFNAPYVWSIKKEEDARVIYPSRDESVENLTLQQESLLSKRGALPLEALADVIERITVAHGRAQGSLIPGANIQ
jgi:hypothetical protein